MVRLMTAISTLVKYLDESSVVGLAIQSKQQQLRKPQIGIMRVTTEHLMSTYILASLASIPRDLRMKRGRGSDAGGRNPF